MAYFDTRGFDEFCQGLGDPFDAKIIDDTLEFSTSAGGVRVRNRFNLALRNALDFLKGWLEHYDEIAADFKTAGQPLFKYKEAVFRKVVGDYFGQYPTITGLGGTQTKALFFTLSKLVGFVLRKPNCVKNEELLLDRDSLEAFFAQIRFGPTEPSSGYKPMSDLTLDDLVAAVRRAGLVITVGTCARVLAALRAGKHLMLTGPPGTGKTTFAIAIADAAKGKGICSDPLVATGTADWTSVDTLGGYWLNEAEQLEFKEGLVLRSSVKGSWLVVDEFNRADVDKAFGAMFTVLSGHPARLAYRVKGTDGQFRDVEIAESAEQVSDDTAPYVLGESWRLVGTLNDWDRDLLFDMSFALQRRFAAIPVPAPERTDYESLIDGHEYPKGSPASGWARATGKKLIGMPPAPLGPAILLDVVNYLTEREAIVKESGGEADGNAILDALQAFVVPQMVHLGRMDRQNAIQYLVGTVLSDIDGASATRQLAAAIDVDANVFPALQTIEEDLEALG